MLHKLYLQLPFFLSALISYGVLMQLDKRCGLVKRIDSKIKVKQGLKSVTYLCVMFFALMLLAILNLNSTIYDCLTGIVVGIVITFTSIKK